MGVEPSRTSTNTSIAPELFILFSFINFLIILVHLKKINQTESYMTRMFFLLCCQTPLGLPGLPQYLSPSSPQSQQPFSTSQLTWLAQLAASSSGECVVVLGDQISSLAQGIQQTFSGLMEGRLKNTNYVVVIVTAPEQETQSCVIVTGESFSYACPYKKL